MSAAPLYGLRVVDFGQGVAGPYCGQLLADHGADVIKVEPPRGDWSRTLGAEGGVFFSVNRNKRGLCLDLRDGEACVAARELALAADVVVESFRPGVMERLGLGAIALRAERPELVYCSVTGFGPDGPNVDLPAGDSIMQAYGGLMSIVGERDGPPLRVGNVVSDMVAGTNAFAGVLLALIARQRSGQGQHVRVSLLDSIVAFQAPPLSEFLLTGSAPRRIGNDHPLIAPSGTFRASDGALTLTVFDHRWPAFCAGMGKHEWLEDARFASSELRQRHRDDLNATLAPLLLSRPRNEWLAELRRIDVPCAPVNEYPDLVADAQVRHNGLIGALQDGSGRSVPDIRGAIQLEAPTPLSRAAPQLGEHTREVLRDLTGWTPERLTALFVRGAAIQLEAGIPSNPTPSLGR